MTENDDDIETLTNELKQLTIERNRIERRRQSIEQRLQRISTKANQRQSSAVKTTYLPLGIEEKIININGVSLQVGNKVEYLSQGVQQSTTGEIESFGKRFVVTRDKYGRQVNKEPHRLRRILE